MAAFELLDGVAQRGFGRFGVEDADDRGEYGGVGQAVVVGGGWLAVGLGVGVGVGVPISEPVGVGW